MRDGRFAYYGTADATSWWLVVLATLGDARWPPSSTRTCARPAGWLERALAAGGGLVRHGVAARRRLAHRAGATRSTPRSADGGGFVREDGTAPVPPIADADSRRDRRRRCPRRRGAARRRGLAPAGGELAERVQAHFGPDVIALEAGDRP